MRYIVMHKSVRSCVAGTSCWIHQTWWKKKVLESGGGVMG